MINIAIDGPSGSGKGALSDGLAKKLNLIHLDTGAIFRGIAVGFLKAGFTDPSEKDIINLLPKHKIEVIYENNKQNIFLNNENITMFLRAEEVSKLSSKLSANKMVREKYLDIVRAFSSNNDCVIDGRDITSVVLPNAKIKFYLTASEEVRAKRRYDENIQKNINCTFEEVSNNLKERDWRDSHRDIAPLKIVEDAIIVDNSNLSIDETIKYCYEIILEKLKENEW